ncbi:MAG: hypothetical protein Q8P54_00655 [bacterium]|nr:hypothetical protein [bacterium]
MSSRPVVLVDIDDTLADTQVKMLEYVNRNGDKTYQYHKLTREFRDGKIADYEKLVQEYLSRPDLVEEILPYDNTLEAMQRLETGGYEIHIVSTRKEPLHNSTIKWLSRHGFDQHIKKVHPRPSEKIGHKFKQDTANLVNAVAAFDDTLRVVIAMAEIVPVVYLIDKPWNQGKLPRNIVRVSSFVEAVDLFLV